MLRSYIKRGLKWRSLLRASPLRLVLQSSSCWDRCFWQHDIIFSASLEVEAVWNRILVQIIELSLRSSCLSLECVCFYVPKTPQSYNNLFKAKSLVFEWHWFCHMPPVMPASCHFALDDDMPWNSRFGACSIRFRLSISIFQLTDN